MVGHDLPGWMIRAYIIKGQKLIRGSMDDRERLKRIINAAQDTKAEQVVCFDMENRSSITDYVVICNGRSQAHVRGIADRIMEEMKKAEIMGKPMEGYQEGSWILLDFDVVLVHVFHPETRAYYDLDGLLQDFPREAYPTPEEEASPSASGLTVQAQGAGA